ncbi:MAG TPA: hypothetical protein VMW16_17170 [Sedimentisphaerales bacterium]|nr:hypothetical protein [Sedimentisphaerales bacterium]
MNKQNVRLDLVTIDSGTQQRPIDPDVLSRYRTLMQDGVEFPPVEVVSDGVNFWLWDGFHRYRCAQERGKKSISAYVTKGKLRDAIWLSFSANNAHGLPRQKGVARKIIASILTDKSWSKKSLSTIAKHTGVTKQYVSLVKNELVQAHRSSTLPIDEEKPPSEAKNEGAAPTTDPDLQRDEEITVTRKGTTYKQKSQENERKADEPPKDAAGRVIPEHLLELWSQQQLVKGLIRDLDIIKNTVGSYVEDRHPAFGPLNHAKFRTEIMALRGTLKDVIPYAICPYCGGEASENCKVCRGFGFLNKHNYELTPQDLR